MNWKRMKMDSCILLTQMLRHLVDKIYKFFNLNLLKKNYEVTSKKMEIIPYDGEIFYDNLG